MSRTEVYGLCCGLGVSLASLLRLSQVVAGDDLTMTPRDVLRLVDAANRHSPTISREAGPVPNLEACRVLPQVAVFRSADPDDDKNLVQADVLIWPNGYALWRIANEPAPTGHTAQDRCEFRFGKASDQQMRFFQERQYRANDDRAGSIRRELRFVHHTLRFQVPETHIAILEGPTHFRFSSQITTGVTDADLARWGVDSNSPKKDTDAFAKLRTDIASRLPSTYKTVSPAPVFELIVDHASKGAGAEKVTSTKSRAEKVTSTKSR